MAKKSRGKLHLYFLNVPKIQATFRKALQYNIKPTEETFPELPDVLIWLRFFLAVIYGSFLGLRSVRSATMVLHNVNLLAFVPVMYCRMYLGVADDSFQMAMVFSGLFPALALSMLLWIYFFTAENEGEAQRLGSLLVNAVVNATADTTIDADATVKAAGVDESEF